MPTSRPCEITAKLRQHECIMPLIPRAVAKDRACNCSFLASTVGKCSDISSSSRSILCHKIKKRERDAQSHLKLCLDPDVIAADDE